MSNDRESAGDEGSGNGNDKTVAKTAGFVVFSGIAMSIIKALNPFNKPDLKMSPNTTTNIPPEPINSFTESTQPQAQLSQQCQPSLITPPPEPIIIKKPNSCIEQNVEESLPRVVEIERGDTLWGLSRKYGVSVEAIKEANGLTGDTIYAGKKLTIP
ncbi:hypothetical protein ACH5RR_028507 [Cinchona calisaya]|uniref:LysM domain-containing protein n=1 Tax=Cinchona calisaya TaxID=153742 RepID=A0ABD2YNZ7_9GENT